MALATGKDLNGDELNDVFVTTSFNGTFDLGYTDARYEGVGFFIYGKQDGYESAEYSLESWLQNNPHFTQRNIPFKSNALVILDDINGDDLPEIAMSRYYFLSQEGEVFCH